VYISSIQLNFFSDSYQAEQLLKEVCVHSVTGIMKLYLRELPEALFTDALYEKVSNVLCRKIIRVLRR